LKNKKYKQMKPSLLLSRKAWMAFVIACSGILLLSSCGKNDDFEPEPVGDLQIRAVNTVNGSASQDLLVNSAVKISAVAYGSASAYATITSGVSTLGFYDTGTTTTVNAGGQANLPIGAKVSIYYFIAPTGGKFATLLDDATAAPASGKAKVRFMNRNSFLNNTLAVAIEGGSSVIPSVPYGETSNYIEVNPGAKFNFTAAGVIAGPAFDGPIVADKIYTIWIDGTSATNLTGHLVLQN
jgi:hypothetical protein